ncbi:unnamed protein product [Owenia fusiformis]|uniref:Uncharacterized protein n=1 Tax=Owenia fusiformis TaxID=6347 RepID=A0A8J1XZ17_OWEFU|nr:unnamed protein product [Owenia fusiformis]
MDRTRVHPSKSPHSAWNRYMDEEIARKNNDAIYNKVYNNSMKEYYRKQAQQRSKQRMNDIKRNDAKQRMYDAIRKQELESHRKWIQEQDESRSRNEVNKALKRQQDIRAELVADQFWRPKHEEIEQNRNIRGSRNAMLEYDLSDRLNDEGRWAEILLNQKYREKDKQKHERHHDFWLSDILGLQKRRDFEVERLAQQREDRKERQKERLNNLYAEHRRLGVSQREVKARDQERLRRIYQDASDTELGMQDVERRYDLQQRRLHELALDNTRINSEVMSLGERLRRQAILNTGYVEPIPRVRRAVSWYV